jgi:hypothetical protein
MDTTKFTLGKFCFPVFVLQLTVYIETVKLHRNFGSRTLVVIKMFVFVMFVFSVDITSAFSNTLFNYY